MPDPNGFIITDQRLQPLRSTWIEVLERYCLHQEWLDTPWMYSERPLVGMLSAAIWQAGGITLEEYSAEKIADNKDEKRGRTDLYFSLNRGEFICEAKHEYRELKKCTGDWREACVANSVNSAKYQIDEGEELVAICFWSIHARYETSDHTISNGLSELAKNLAPAPDSMFLSWHFPKGAFAPREESEPRYLGLVMEMIKMPKTKG